MLYVCCQRVCVWLCMHVWIHAIEYMYLCNVPISLWLLDLSFAPNWRWTFLFCFMNTWWCCVFRLRFSFLGKQKVKHCWLIPDCLWRKQYKKSIEKRHGTHLWRQKKTTHKPTNSSISTLVKLQVHKLDKNVILLKYTVILFGRDVQWKQWK